MALKRQHIELDPDYEDVSEAQNKRRRVLEEGAKEATKKRIENIVDKQFNIEVSNKETELLNISERLEMARTMMDRLRACVVADYFGNANQQKSQRRRSDQAPLIHPSVRKFIGKAPVGTPHAECSSIKTEPTDGLPTQNGEVTSERIGKMTTVSVSTHSTVATNIKEDETRTGRFKVKKRIIVGNVSRSIPADERDENDQATHKWMVYVRGPKHAPKITDFVKKVWFFLHPSYRPNDLVEVREPPFHLTRRGWGEFPVRVQLHFRDHRNKRLDIIHHLKLDRTYTGLQTLGAETLVDVEIEREVNACSSRAGSVVTSVKREDGDLHCENSTMSSAPRIKTEPVDDHEYGSSTVQAMPAVCLNGDTVVRTPVLDTVVSDDRESVEKSPMLANMLIACKTGSLVQTAVRPSIITTQPLTAVTPTKNNTFNLTVRSPGSNSRVRSPGSNSRVQSPARNVVLKGFGSLSSPALDNNKKEVQLNLSKQLTSNIITSPVKNVNSVNYNMNTPKQLILSNKKATGAQVGSQLKLNTATSGNSSVNPGIIFLKCTDTQGKTFLIPQQVCSSVQTLTPVSGGQIRMSMASTQPMLLASSLPSVVTSAFISPQPAHVIQSSVNTLKTPVHVSSPKSAVQNTSVLFIKPDNTGSWKGTSLIQPKFTVATPDTSGDNKQNAGTGLQILRQTLPSHNIASKTMPAGNQSLLRGQMKVTSQGLIHIQGQNNAAVNDGKCIKLEGNIVKSLPAGVHRQIDGSTVKSVSAGQHRLDASLVKSVSASPHRQSLILVPASVNNRLAVNSGKTGKSLLSNICVGQSNGNVLVLNQSGGLTGTSSSVGKLVLSSPPATPSKTDTSLASHKHTYPHTDLTIIPAKQQKSPANHIVIVPVTTTHQSTVTLPTITQSNSKITDKLPTTFVNSNYTNTGKVSSSVETKNNDKSMLIVVQNEQTRGTNVTVSSTATSNNSPQTQKTASVSLLGSKSSSSSVISSASSSSLSSMCETEVPVTISSTDQGQKQVLVVNDIDQTHIHDKSLTSATWIPPLEKEKKIISIDPKRRKLIKQTPEIILPLYCRDYVDIRSLVKAAVLRHPVVSDTHGRQLHPYCAKSHQDWLSWNVGKRRASEWQRASAVRHFLLSYLDSDSTYRGEKMWTVKQILTWCRLHAYSPHYLEKPLHPTSIDLQAQTSLGSGKHNNVFSSLTSGKSVIQEVTSLEPDMTPSDDNCDEIDIISTETTKVKHKKPDTESNTTTDSEFLPLVQGSSFVDNVSQQMGVKFQPSEVTPDYHGNITQGFIYRAMESFMEDVLRHTFALQVNMGRYPDTLGVTDVFAALSSLPVADFLTNNYLGMEQNSSAVPLDRSQTSDLQTQHNLTNSNLPANNHKPINNGL